MKYIVLRDLKTGEELPVFCVAPMHHQTLAGAFAATHETVAAGFCERTPDGTAWHAWGFSQSLNVKSRGAADGALITALVHATRRLAQLVA